MENAKTMFEKLGYKLANDCEYYLFYEKPLKENAEYENDYIHLEFDFKDKTICKSYGDDNTYWSITSYVDNLGFIVPIYATNYSYGIR